MFPLEIVVWFFGTFDNNFGIKNGFAKYLIKNYWQCFNSIPIKYIPNFTL